MSSISVSSLVLGSLTVEVDGSDASLALSVLGTAPASLTIELGTPGAQGNAATIAVGTTTTLSPGSPATVTNAGTSSAAVFNFGIPQGTTGATGATGPGVAAGGVAGQSLLKVDGTDYNTTWGTPPLATLATSAETVIATVRNNTGATLTAGQVVYISGAAGNRAAVALAQANLEATSSGTYGMVSAPIANNSDGTIVIAGFVANINTSAFTDGDLLYLSPTVAGGFTSTKPTAPDNLVYIGVVARAHPNQGVIQLRISNGFELDELHDVSASSPSNNDLLTFETSSNLWKNKSAATLGLATTAASDAAYLAKASNLSDLANTGTARTNLGLGTAAVEPATKLVPSGGTTGQVLAKASATSWDLTWATSGGGGGGGTVTTYSTPGTYSYTIPAGATQLRVMLWGAGGGGGSGARNATTGVRSGGGGGGGGSFYAFTVAASTITSPVTVVVAAGGAGAAAQTVNGTAGNNGTTQATLTSFGDFITQNGVGGTGGVIVGTSASGGSSRPSYVEIGGGNSAAGGLGSTTSDGGTTTIGAILFSMPTGGGGGGGRAASVFGDQRGGNGGSKQVASSVSSVGYNIGIAGGAGAIAGVSSSTAGSSFTNNFGGTGGGGGAYRTAVSSTISNGSNGGSPGGGGGGGGASDNGFNSGSGGNGADGRVVIIAY